MDLDVILWAPVEITGRWQGEVQISQCIADADTCYATFYQDDLSWNFEKYSPLMCVWSFLYCIYILFLIYSF